MRRRTTRLAAIVFAAVSLTVGLTMFATPAHAQPQPGISDPWTATHYLNEWNGNTAAGGTIRIYGPAGNEDWGEQGLWRCGGTTVTHTCPFTVGSGMNDEYFGSDIVQFDYIPHDTTCLGADLGSHAAINRSCNDTDTGSGGGTGTVFILHCYQNPFRCDAINLYYSNNQGSPRFMCSDSLANGAFLNLAYAPGTCGTQNQHVSQWVEWY